MKCRTFTCFTVVALFAAPALPGQLAAQHTRYKLINIGTLGGPINSVNGDGFRLLNNAVDPNAPNLFAPGATGCCSCWTLPKM